MSSCSTRSASRGERRERTRRRFRLDVRGFDSRRSASRRVRPSRARSSAIGAEVAFVNVGGKGEAADRDRRTEGRRRRSRGRGRRPHPGDGRVDRGRADAFPAAGARGRDRRGSSKTRSTPVCRWRARSNGDVKGGYEVRIGPPARLLPVLPDRHRPDHGSGAARRACLHVPDHRVQGRRQEPHRLAACAARGGAARQRRRGPAVDRPWARC